MKKIIFSCIFLIHTIFISVILARMWHAFDPILANKMNNLYCYKFEKHKLHQGFHVWPGLTEHHYTNKLPKRHKKVGLSLPYWEYAVNQIYKHQNPNNCSNVKFLVVKPYKSGFGSEFHVYSAALGLAMSIGRVLIQHPVTDDSLQWQVNNTFCREYHKLNLECYFEPWSHCTIQDALGSDAIETYFSGDDHTGLIYANANLDTIAFHSKQQTNYTKLKTSVDTFIRDLNRVKTLVYQVDSYLSMAVIPIQLYNLTTQCLPMQHDRVYYWWRAVAASYLVRPNSATFTFLDNQRKCTSCPHYYRSGEEENVVSIYIRHGDKGPEMTLIQTERYLQAADYMFKTGIVHTTTSNKNYEDNSYSAILDFINKSSVPYRYRHNRKRRLIFLGTETPAVVEEARRWCVLHNYTMLYTNLVNRNETLSGTLNATLMASFDHKGHPPNEYLSMLLNIDISLRSAAWVCTLGSNWCRLIDELRATVAYKANWVFVDLSKESCPLPPCFGFESDVNRVSNFGW